MKKGSEYLKYKVGEIYCGSIIIRSLYMKGKQHMGDFMCSCGKVFSRAFSNMKRGNLCTTCSIERAANAKRLYPKEVKKLYKIWKNMNQRCSNPKDVNYHNYGGRGITVCKEWCDSNKDGLFNLFKDLPPRPGRSSLDRIDNDKGYYKENVRWSTQKQQCNNKRTNTLILVDGKQYTISEASEVFKIKQNTITWRIIRGWTPEEAVGIVDRPVCLNGRKLSADNTYLGKLTDEQITKLHALNDGKCSYENLAKQVGASHGSVYNYLRKYPVNLFFTDLFGNKIIVGKNFKQTYEIMEHFKVMLKDGKAASEISKELGINISSVYYLRNRLGWREYEKSLGG